MSPDTIVPGAANPQAFNRYSYVLGNPLKYTDPTGHYCVGDDEDCADEAGDSPVPTGTGVNSNNGNCGNGGGGGDPHDDDDFDPNPNGDICGLHGDYSPSCPGWHEYTTTNVVCPANLNSTEAQMQDYLYQFAYPSQDPNFPVNDGDVNTIKKLYT